MSYESFTRLALSNPVWTTAWTRLDGDFRDELTARKLDSPLVWGNLLKGSTAHELRAHAAGVLTAFQLHHTTSTTWSDRLDWSVEHHQSARGVTNDWALQTAAVPNCQLYLEHAQAAKRARLEVVERDLARASEASRVAIVPAVWRGKLYTWQEAAGDPRAREKAEQAERLHYGKRVVELLKEADLPFGREVAAKGWPADSDQAFRCLRGLRGASLRRRCSDWAPCRRFLLGAHGTPFPTGTAQLLDFFDAREVPRLGQPRMLVEKHTDCTWTDVYTTRNKTGHAS